MLRGPQDHVKAATAELQRRRDAILRALPGWPLVRPAGGWSLLLDAHALGTTAPEASQDHARARRGAATAMTGWGAEVAARHVRFVFSAEPLGAPRGPRAPGALTASLGAMSELTDLGLLPAEHRALRELHATARHVQDHWMRLAGRLGGAPAQYLQDGAATADELLGELDADDLKGQPAAQGVGARLAGARGVSDLLLERNQAFRGALLDLQHVTTLLAYLAGLATTRGDPRMAARHETWAARLKPPRRARTRHRRDARGRPRGRDRPRRRRFPGPRGPPPGRRRRDDRGGDRPLAARPLRAPLAVT